MAKKKDEDEDETWWGITTAERWQKATDVFDIWCMARDQAKFNRALTDKRRKYNRRLLYLMGVAACQRVADLFPHSCCHKALEVAEAFAEGTAKVGKLEEAVEAVDLMDDAESDLPVMNWAAARAVFWLGPDDYRVTDALEMVVDVAGYRAALAAKILKPNSGYDAGERVWGRKPFKDGKKKEEKALCGIVRDVLGNPFKPVVFSKKWCTDTAASLAKQMYDSRDFGAMPILADALQDAGCDDSAILNHCRDAKQVHVRGCWVVDGVLGKN